MRRAEGLGVERRKRRKKNSNKRRIDELIIFNKIFVFINTH